MNFPEEFRFSKPSHHYRSSQGDNFGLFIIPGRHDNGRRLVCIADDGANTGWEHVSVSLPDSPKKCPAWPEMCIVKDLFWDAGETVVQYHPPKEDYVNFHPGVLHLWRCVESVIGVFPRPPAILVGPKTGRRE
jgi:hypothetical protein